MIIILILSFQKAYVYEISKFKELCNLYFKKNDLKVGKSTEFKALLQKCQIFSAKILT